MFTIFHVATCIENSKEKLSFIFKDILEVILVPSIFRGWYVFGIRKDEFFYDGCLSNIWITQNEELYLWLKVFWVDFMNGHGWVQAKLNYTQILYMWLCDKNYIPTFWKEKRVNRRCLRARMPTLDYELSLVKDICFFIIDFCRWISDWRYFHDPTLYHAHLLVFPIFSNFLRIKQSN